jgi:rSAM/selenodomain-associated transferase 1
MSCRVIIFAKAPIPGQVKTRLAADIGIDAAARLADRMLSATIARAAAARIGPVELCCATNINDSLLGAHADAFRAFDVTLSAQGEGDLGERMSRVFQRALALSDAVLLIGTDAPKLNEGDLFMAAAALDEHPAVIVPALDGGYVLIGL